VFFNDLYQWFKDLWRGGDNVAAFQEVITAPEVADSAARFGDN